MTLTAEIHSERPARPGPSAQAGAERAQDHGAQTRGAHAKETAMFLRQLFDPQTSTYTYLVADPVAGKAALIDPVAEQAERDAGLLAELGFELVAALDTHVHADHVTACGLLRERLGARTYGATNGADCTDVKLSHGDIVEVGALRIEALATPGHTDDSMSFRVGDALFTGDALLVRGCGRTDFQNGDAGTLYDSITQQLFAMPPETKVWPGHDYRGQSVSTIGEEQAHNPRVAGKSRAEFIELMENLNLPRPQRIDEAVPANRACGKPERTSSAAAPAPAEAGGMQATSAVRAAWERAATRPGGYRDVDTAGADLLRGEIRIIDVRGRDEFTGELGHIPGAELVPLGDLAASAKDWPRDEPILLICRSGRRSASGATDLVGTGFRWVLNLEGGMMAWADKGLPVVR